MVVKSGPEVIACTAMGVGRPEVKGICCRCGVTLAANECNLFIEGLYSSHFVFYICLSVRRFVEGKICTLFCLAHFKKRSFLTSCLF